MSEGKVKRKIIFLIFAAVMVVAGGCGTDGGDTEASRDLFAMDTYMTVTAYGKGATEAVDQAADEISRLDQLLSTGNEDSEIYKINQSGDGILSEETAYLVERSLDLYEATDGAFDIAIYPVMKVWGFTDDNFRVPDADELKDLLTLTDASDISYDKETSQIVFKKDGMQIGLWRNRERLYFCTYHGYFSCLRDQERTGQSWWKCAGTWNKEGWKQLARGSAGPTGYRSVSWGAFHTG